MTILQAFRLTFDFLPRNLLLVRSVVLLISKSIAVENYIRKLQTCDLERIRCCLFAIRVCFQIFRQARRTAPSIIYMPNVRKWWESAPVTVQHTFEALLKSLPASVPVILIGKSFRVDKTKTFFETWLSLNFSIFTTGKNRPNCFSTVLRLLQN